jgi:predicted membrane protein
LAVAPHAKLPFLYLTKQRIMETNYRDNKKDNFISTDRSGRIWGGLVLVLIGAVLLGRELGYFIPSWLFSWEVLVIAISVFIGARKNFALGGWLVGVAIGGVFLLDDVYPDLNLKPYFWPVLIIGFGLFMIFRPKRKGPENWTGEITSDESIEAVSIFAGTKKNIVTKNFKGGEVVTVFGGTDLDLTQADFTGTAKIEVSNVFGGTKLRVPANWRIKSEMVSIFGGVDDKRPQAGEVDGSKLLVLEGACLFGGIELKSF